MVCALVGNPAVGERQLFGIVKVLVFEPIECSAKAIF